MPSVLLSSGPVLALSISHLAQLQWCTLRSAPQTPASVAVLGATNAHEWTSPELFSFLNAAYSTPSLHAPELHSSAS
ncbi:uncharacterized protein M421DRAFT_422882 [Didymella exigua CBS 183.55]|uniref:Uncharacterized protein n=1 Tax=Didymella exigua CBS 183.55 TaxID=1150837 RepID=A0A6A5RIE8_9PLEO|nr:uncharacterized protein M421DRAFT_422882 [Didymella exigua CBS 183.55]KAF1926206.1 hypothetical protein M421DRAFT_422882 [Didymella exigua CBS 183.55]